jgi:hypothetical protein
MLPDWLIEAAKQLDRPAEGVAIGFAAAGWTHGYEEGFSAGFDAGVVRRDIDATYDDTEPPAEEATP